MAKEDTQSNRNPPRSGWRPDAPLIERLVTAVAGNFRPQNLKDLLDHLSILAPILDALPNVVFFIKNPRAEYVLVNQTLAKRCGLDNVEDVLGKPSRDVFNSRQGNEYTEQDYEVLRTGNCIADKLELHFYSSGELGWCLTHKMPIYGAAGDIIAMAGVSVDIQSDELNQPGTNERLEKVEAYVRTHFDQVIRMEQLADISGLSMSQLERNFKKIFHTTPLQFIQKIRLEHALRLLAQDLTITDISARCGYTDHSAFSRQFKQVTGVSPSQFKETRAIYGRAIQIRERS
ncbi:AraC family transcriptional regulator [Advenella kashmirensis W13003]|uniref:AraC family transcriptional regulator n=1 Tax=Advenella kashmirensis W13003 TaxID=1424334 RepID=V8QXT5_9BURK|nr:AraC family transcriptional regulator [Advenella kashmirensis]ETF04168.1 AraC family transcriptional regulator [Advenella kashmirensis W13003]